MLDSDLITRIEAADREYQRQVGLRLVLRAAPYAALPLFLVFALDVVFHFEGAARAALTAVLVLAALGLGAWVYYVAQIRRNRIERIARILESRDAALGSRLINFLQLRVEARKEGHSDLTRRLAESAVAGYNTSLAQRDLRPLTRFPDLARNAKIAALGLGVSLAVLLLLFPVSSREVLRFLDPFGDHPPYSLTRLNVVDPADDSLLVTYGKSAVVKVKAAGHQPEDLFLTFVDPARPNEEHTLPMFNKGDLGFVQEIENIRSDLVFYAHTKNRRSISNRRRVNVSLTPQIEKAFFEVRPPAYTEIKPEEKPFPFKTFTALEGSEVRFRLVSNRPLAGGRVDFPAEGPPRAPVELKPSAESEVAGGFAATETSRLQFFLRDTADNPSQDNPTASLTVTHDLPPAIEIESPAADAFVCDDFTIDARIAASDDYGLKTIRIHRSLNDVFSAPKVISFDTITRNAGETVLFDVAKLGVKSGDVISLFAEAIDNCPEPHLAHSKTIRLMVISTEEYNDYLRERTDISLIQSKYAALLNEFQDLVDEQRKLSEQAAELEKSKDPASAAKELDKLAARQAELNQKLNAMADRMEHFVRDKPVYDLESGLKDALKDKAEQIRSSVAQNDEALRKTLEKLASSEVQDSRMESVASLHEESDKQLERLGEMRKQAEQQMMPPLEDAAKMNAIANDLNAIRALQQIQTAAAEQAKAYAERTVLADEDRLALKQLAGTEKEIEQALEKVMANLKTHADEAEKTFPKAAAGARDLAAAMEGLGLTRVARQAVNTMLAGQSGPEAARIAERLRQDIDSLFQQAEEGAGQMGQEMDQYMRLQRMLNAGNTFDQMRKGRGLGFGNAFGTGGNGAGGLDGYAVTPGNNYGVFGNETMTGSAASSQPGGHGVAGSSKAAQPEAQEADQLSGVPSANRPSEAGRSEAPLDDYREVIDAYFNSITLSR